MAYFAPYVDSSGLHLSPYTDIFNYGLNSFLSVYGKTVNTGNDSADVEWVSLFTLMINDAFQLAQLDYNSRSPTTAVGSALDSIVKINGIYRKNATASTVPLVISGVAGTVINNGVVQDTSGFLWDLPAQITIPNTGTITVTAACETLGAVSAEPGTIIIISNPTRGWNKATNFVAATLGVPLETDSQLRARQAISVGISAKTLVSSTIASIAAVPGVTRWNPGVQTPGAPGTSVENPTGAIDTWGNPPHSITMVVEGGADLDVATAIYNCKTPGCLTNGSTTVPVVDPYTQATMNISFYRPTYLPVFVSLTIKPLSGYSSAIAASIQTSIVNYLNSLQIGEELTISALYGAALSIMPNLSQPQFSIVSLQAGLSESSLSTNDITIQFNQVVQGLPNNVNVEVA